MITPIYQNHLDTTLTQYHAYLSWYFEDSSHGDGLTEGLDDVQ
jgi:hypothetical protein